MKKMSDSAENGTSVTDNGLGTSRKFPGKQDAFRGAWRSSLQA